MLPTRKFAFKAPHVYLLALFVLLLATFPALFPEAALSSEPVDVKPKLPYLFSLPDAAAEMVAELQLSRIERLKIEQIVEAQDERLAGLNRVSNVRLLSTGAGIEAARFNHDAGSSEQAARQDIADMLGVQSDRFDEWAEDRWRREVAEHGIQGFSTAAQTLTHRVYATQYFAYTNYEVAIPDKYIKFANLGWENRAGYEGNNYTVNLNLNGKAVSGVKVLDVGPWNIDDNYWNGAGDSVRPRRLYADLPRGMPEAQAAFFNNYNGGKDQFGRTVLNPAGIDLSPAVGQDLGLGYLQNGWIDVTYNWEAAQFGETKIIAPNYSTGRSKASTFRVSWTGADSGFSAGLASYSVQYRPANTSTWTNWKVRTTETQASFVGTPGRTYYFRARAVGTDGAVGNWSPVRRTIVPYDQNRLLHRKAGFARVFSGANSSYYLGTTRYSTTRGTYIAYKFTGTSIALISAMGPTRSKAKIYIDGKYVKTIDNYSPRTRARRIVFHHAWDRSGTHYIKVVNLATPGRPRFDIDGVAVGR